MIRTERLVIREILPIDKEFFIGLYSNQGTMTFIDNATTNRERLLEEFNLRLNSWKRSSGFPKVFVVSLRLERNQAKQIGVFNIISKSSEIGELSYFFLPESWGHSYAKEAFIALKSTFKKYGYTRLYAKIASDNLPSIQFATSLQFQKGMLSTNTIFSNGHRSYMYEEYFLPL